MGDDNPNTGDGLDFNGGSPLSLVDSAMPFTLGCSSYCSSSGELLFYSNGITVYNRTHYVMFNGDSMGGGLNTQQSVLIVPFAKDTNMYYNFANSGTIFDNDSGLQYSIIDTTLHFALGAVVNPKVINLIKKTNGQLTMCNHSNGKDFWVITVIYYSNKFYGYQITDDGIRSPIISRLDFEDVPSFNIEIRPKGNIIALIVSINHIYNRYIIDFDTGTGKLSNSFQIANERSNSVRWDTGCSFSPGTNLFYNMEYESGVNILYQYDLYSSDIIS